MPNRVWVGICGAFLLLVFVISHLGWKDSYRRRERERLTFSTGKEATKNVTTKKDYR